MLSPSSSWITSVSRRVRTRGLILSTNRRLNPKPEARNPKQIRSPKSEPWPLNLRRALRRLAGLKVHGPNSRGSCPLILSTNPALPAARLSVQMGSRFTWKIPPPELNWLARPTTRRLEPGNTGLSTFQCASQIFPGWWREWMQLVFDVARRSWCG